MKKITSTLSSMLVTGLLILVFGISIAYATFIENDYGTITAKVLVYNAWWFEVLLGVLCINIIGSIFRYKLVSRKKWPMLLFHVAFVITIIGAGFTRYKGYEGMMHIREGEASNTIVSTDSYIQIQAQKNGTMAAEDHEVLFSPYANNPFSESLKVDQDKLTIKNLMYMPNAKEEIQADPNGIAMVSLIFMDDNGQRKNLILKEGENASLGHIQLGINDPGSDLNFRMEKGQLYLKATDTLLSTAMNQATPDQVLPGYETEINTKAAYTLQGSTFAVSQYIARGKTDLVYMGNQNASLPDALKLRVSSGNESQELVVYGKKGQAGVPVQTRINGIDLSISYGSKYIRVPFEIHLSDFQLERYPGSNSPSSFASEVILKDAGREQPFRIFMNNILKYKGYRFFQSSYDQDEMGTILSVNSDSLGTTVTYLGYLLMIVGMLLGLFNKNSRFWSLVNTSAKIRSERQKIISVLVFMVLLSGISGGLSAQTKKDHLKDFETLTIQNRKGRIEPVSTVASQILRKISKQTEWDGKEASQLLLEMMVYPDVWKNKAIIKVGNADLRKRLGIIDGKYTSFNSIVAPTEQGGYKLAGLVNEAYAKKSNERNKFDKEVIYVDERINILMNVISGSYLRIFPVPNEDNNAWISVNEVKSLSETEADQVKMQLGNYLAAVAGSDWRRAQGLLDEFKMNQKKWSAEVLPSDTKVKLEVLYNKWNIFGKLAKIFLFSGLFLLALQLVEVFNPNIQFKLLQKLALILITLLFIAETSGLGIRWYISGHAPWSNGYESMIFISWATCLGGLILVGRSRITFSLTTILAGLTLLVAGMSWMNPEITNLVPVLKSYWLIVHVAVITASYGFLGISALLGFLNLGLIVSRTQKNRIRIDFTVQELVNIIRIALIIGLLLLTIGSFLGGVWANESWGRYWGWDPKETWALVTILVYTFITHMHRIPGFKGDFAMSTAALVGFSSVLMTYFGVNYYLSGLHSYAQGESAPIPMGLYVGVAVVLVVIAMAFVSEKKAVVREVGESK